MPVANVITIEAARAAKDEAKRQFARLPGVVGVGLTRLGSGYALKVNLGHGSTADQVPARVNGVPVVVEVVGAIVPR